MADKYKVVYFPCEFTHEKHSYPSWEKQINTLYKKGYEVFIVKDKFMVMRLSESQKYEDVTNLKDVPPAEVDQHLSTGWEIASASISTKFVRMIKRRTP